MLLFDGVCNLCNASVDFVIRRDKRGRIRFAPLQSEIAEKLLPGHDRTGELESSVLVLDGEVYRESTAALKVAHMLAWPWPLLYAFIVVPRPIRDVVYRWIGRNRYRWFGKRETCRLPSAEERGRFLAT